ncbi:hypothetical protein K432DRAFT_428101 [Lepidopterella palustris CBS 459.81]|uniref:Peptidase C14 caspase domain-containing protein n=1 Tax=Lepidopterella palustris CBS 459.81 TaxID=1314670 RepID=A0A8E2E4N5_9PEZI|nr:hypothetical protein K432DRAFT_428101 [Lepidopterella palustris CBS 459.81]
MDTAPRPSQLDPIDTHNAAVDTILDGPPDSCTSPQPPKKELQQLQKAFDANMNNSTKPVCHNHTAVLCLSWEAKCDDLKTENEVNELASVLKDTYKFDVTRKLLPEERPQKRVNSILAKFLDRHDKEHGLLIIYYAGHGWCDENQVFKLGPRNYTQQHAFHRRDDIAWKNAENQISSPEADVLIIFDCCEAGAWQQSRSPRRIFEFLGACKQGERTRSPGPSSFTSALIWALKELSTKAAFQTSELRNKIKEYPKFPQQDPVLYNRAAPSHDHIWITPPVIDGKEPELPDAEYRDARNEYMDLRLYFNRPITETVVINTAQSLSSLIDNRDFSARRIALKRKSSLIEDYVSHWRQIPAQKKRRISGDTIRSLPTLSPQSTRQDSGSSLHLQIPRDDDENADDSVSPNDDAIIVNKITFRPRVGHLAMRLEPESRANDIKDGVGDDGVSYHMRMLLVRTAENCQSALGWMRDRIVPRTVGTLRNRAPS